MKRWTKQLTCCLLALAFVLGLTGCGGYKLDQNPGEISGSASGSELTEPEGKPADFDVETTADSSTDFSKYEDQPAVTADDNQVQSDAAQDASAPANAGKQPAAGNTSSDSAPTDQKQPSEPAGTDTNTSADTNATTDAPTDSDNSLTCYVTISCAQILNNMDQLEDGKASLVPSNGLLLSRKAVTFEAGETAFDVLKRVTKDNRIHMESRFTPAYNSAYICGIGNLYEFDCGPESGWMYCVNGWYPNYGVSNYELKDQDELQFNYTCDLGRDLGGSWQG